MIKVGDKVKVVEYDPANFCKPVVRWMGYVRDIYTCEISGRVVVDFYAFLGYRGMLRGFNIEEVIPA